jgi:hypothetical protein
MERFGLAGSVLVEPDASVPIPLVAPDETPVPLLTPSLPPPAPPASSVVAPGTPVAPAAGALLVLPDDIPEPAGVPPPL